MGFGLRSMGRAMKGVLGPEALIEMLAGMGVQLTHQELQPGQFPSAFQAAAKTSMVPGAKVLALRGQDREGSKIEALIIMAPGPEPILAVTKGA